MYFIYVVSLTVQEVHTVTFEIESDVVEEKLDEWIQVRSTASCERAILSSLFG